MGLIVFISWSVTMQAQNTTTGVIAGWDFHSLAGGRNNWGPSPLAATSNSPNVTVTGLTRGSGVTAGGNSLARGWGGFNFVSTSAAAAVSAGQFITFAVTPVSGCQVSLSSFSPFGTLCDPVGPTNALLQYSIAGGPYLTVSTLVYTNFSTNTTAPAAVDLTGIPALQNITPGNTVSFRLINYGASSAFGTWYLFDLNDTTQLDFAVQGTVSMDGFQQAYDAGPGFFGGENLVLTNTTGLDLSVWSSPYATVPVTNWYYEGAMESVPVNSGSANNSRYSINLNPQTSPMYYIISTTNNFPFAATEALVILTTDDYADFTVSNTNAPITASGEFEIPTPAAILNAPADTNVFAGQSVSLSVSATGSGTLSYQWLKNSSVLTNGPGLSGAQTSQLNFNPVTTNEIASYSVMVTNLLGGTTSGSAALNVVPVPPLVISNAPGGFVLTAANGAANDTYVIQRATNLASPVLWVPVQTNNVGADGQIVFTGTNGNNPATFYRFFIP